MKDSLRFPVEMQNQFVAFTFEKERKISGFRRYKEKLFFIKRFIL